MKKTIQLLIIISLMFIGINIVNAEDMGTYPGTCALSSNNSDSFDCTYICHFTANHSSLKFDYHVYLAENGKVTHEIVQDTIETSEDSFFGYPKNSPFFSESVTVKIVSNPPDQSFEVNNKLTCTAISAEDNLQRKGSAATGTVSTYYTNNISIEVVSSDTSNDRENLGDNACGFLGTRESEVISILRKIYGYIKVAIPVLVVILSIADFIKVVASGKDDDMKKATSKFAKRIILAVVFILVPIIIQILINLSGITSEYSQINDSIKAIGCILG